MDSEKSHYNKSLKSFARDLRNESTFGEILLWDKLLKAKGTGYQFNRQFALRIQELEIIVDFICRKLNLIIEIDGSSHHFKQVEDVQRDKRLNAIGFTVLRFSEQRVRYDIDNVATEIENTIKQLEEDFNQSP